MNNPFFSFIIPHYNTPRLLERCIQSVPKREDVQVVVVDDNSPVTSELNNTFIQLQKQGIEVYKTPQGGSAGRARNIGLAHARGVWLLFADADDFFAPAMPEFIDKYRNAETDVIYFNYKGVMSDDITKPSSRESDYSGFFQQYEKDNNENNFRFNYQTPWGKMIRRELIVKNNITFDETRYSNDVMFSVKVGCVASKIMVVNQPLYVLTEREGSLSAGFCEKEGEAVIRTQVALNAYKTVMESGFDFHFGYEMFIRILVYNKEYKSLLIFYHSIEKYHIKKSTILNIVRKVGKRYYLLCAYMVIYDAALSIFRR